MEEIKLDVAIRAELGKEGAHKIRQRDGIPAILYGGKAKPATVTVDRRTFERLTRSHRGESIIFHINVMDKETAVQDYHAIIKEMQHHPVSDQITHIDFVRISLKEKIEVKVPVVAQGEPAGVKKGGGSLEHHLWELKVVCLPTEIPKHIDVDVSSLEINQSIFVKDLVLPKGVVAHHDPDTIVLTVIPPMKEEVAKSAEGEATLTEPEVTKEKKKEEAPQGEDKAASKEKDKDKEKPAQK
ncbi:MAG: 50S ribosomal protein L25 [Candidatus Omnitrophica bacterium]|nr:50S ribosomal protein L25 [Candidatus Omnitrophota bacterium]